MNAKIHRFGWWCLLSLLCCFANAAETCPSNATDPQCMEHTPPPSKVYIRDSPLHTKLVQDTYNALHRFHPLSKRNNYRPRYFEGWYYKLDLMEGGGTFVVIPGLYLRHEEQTGFIMILDATSTSSQGKNDPICYYYTFPNITNKIISKVDGDYDFLFQLDDDNWFTAHDFALNLPASRNNPAVVASATWAAPLPLPATRWNPTIMGWFSWLPRGTMQCSHGVVSMDHVIAQGHVTIRHDNHDATTMDLTNARGYIEKDWGREFPERYTWMQANDFESAPGASFMVSVASIPIKPLGGVEFTGFLSFLRYPDKDTGIFRTIRFATYTGAKVRYDYNITSDQPRHHTVVVRLTDSKYTLTATVTGDRDGAATLWGPLPRNPSGGMKPYVREMLQCSVHIVLLYNKNGTIVFEGHAQHGGFEIEGHNDVKKE